MTSPQPHDTYEIEQAVLGAVLLSGRSPNGSSGLAPEDFQDPRHSALYRIILQMVQAGEAVDLVTVHARTIAKNLSEAIGGQAYLSSLNNAVASAAHLDQYAHRLKEKSIRRQLIEAAQSGDSQRLKQAVEQAREILTDRPGDRLDVGTAIPLGEFTVLSLPARETLIDPWLPGHGLVMVWGPRGCGKTWFSFALVLALARGENFGPFRVPKARNSLYIDAEMAAKDTQGRFNSLIRGNDGLEVINRVRIVSGEMLAREGLPALNINLPETQLKIISLIEELETSANWRPAVIVFDNLSALTFGSDENSNSDVDAILPFLLSLRHKGFTVVLVHHAGKSGDQRGSSRKEDQLDTSIALKSVQEGDPGCHFTMRFTKERGTPAGPREVEMRLTQDPDGTLGFVSKAVEVASYERFLTLVGEGLESQKEIADVMSPINKGTISRYATKAKSEGFLDDNLRKLRLSELGRLKYGS